MRTPITGIDPVLVGVADRGVAPEMAWRAGLVLTGAQLRVSP